MTFEEWWEQESGWGGELLAEGNLAKSAWNAALKHAKSECKKTAKREQGVAERITELEDLLFSMGAMEQAPCFCCGYNGSGYFSPRKHPCAARHHNLLKFDDD